MSFQIRSALNILASLNLPAFIPHNKQRQGIEHVERHFLLGAASSKTDVWSHKASYLIEGRREVGWRDLRVCTELRLPYQEA